MKNLKKILVLLTLVAMVVSSVAIMAFAGDEEFTGSIEEADALLTAVDADVNIHNGSYVVTSTRPKTNKEKAAAIVGVYDYVTANNLKAAPGYSEFEQRLHAKSLEFLAEVTNAAFDTSAATSYYTYIIALEVVKSFSSIELLEYKPVTNPIYTGTLEAPAAILAGITDADTYDTLLTKMAGIYTYLATNPVNPMVDGYLEFITEYDARALQLADGIEAAVNSEADLDKKIELLQAVYTVLAGVEDNPETDADESVPSAPISAKVVNKYNDVRQGLIDEYGNMAELLVGAVALVWTPDVKTAGTVAELEDLVEAFGAAVDAGTFDITVAGPAAQAASRYLIEKNIDPSENGYADAIADYKTAVDTFNTKYEAVINQKSTVQEKIDALSVWYSYLSSYPCSESMIAKYNAVRCEIIAACEEIIDLAGGEMPVCVPVQNPTATASVSSLNYNLKRVESACKKYEEEATPENLEAMKTAVEGMYKYLSLVIVDFEAEDYPAFVEKFDELRITFVTALLESVDEAAELAALKDYFGKYPPAKSGVDLYNAKVDEIITDDAQKAAELKLESVYYEIGAAVEALNDAKDAFANASNGEAAAKYADYVNKFKLAYAYLEAEHVVTDKAYIDYMEAYNAAAFDLAGHIEALFEAVGEDFALRNAAVKETYAFLMEAPFSPDVVDLFVAKTEAYALDYTEELVRFAFAEYDSEAKNAPAFVSAYDVISELMAEYTVAEGIEAQKTAFEALYDKFVELNATYIKGKDIDPSHETFATAYAAVCDSFTLALQNYLNAELGGTTEQKYNALVDVAAYLGRVKVSENIVTFYNEKLEGAKTGLDGFNTNKAKVESSVLELMYSAPEGFDGDVSGIFENAGNTLDAESVNELYSEICKLYDDIKILTESRVTLPEKQELLRASEVKIDENREILNNLYKNACVELKGKLCDFAHADYKNLIVGLNTAHSVVADINVKHIAYVADVNEKTNELARFRAYIDSIAGEAFSPEIISGYNTSRNEVFEIHIKAANEERIAFYQDVDHRYLYTIDSHLKNCSLISADHAASSAMITTKLDAMRYAYVEGAILNYDNAHGDLAALTQMTAIDQLNYFSSLNKDYKDSALAELVCAEAFASLLDKIDAIADSAEKAAAVNALKEAIVNNSFPVDLVNAFKAKFAIEDEITPNAFAGTTTPGSVAGFASEIKAFYGVANGEGVAVADIQAAFVNVIAYVNEHPFGATSAYNSMAGVATDIKASRDDFKQEQRELLDSKAPLTEYASGYLKDNSKKPVDINFDFEASTAKKYPNWSYAALLKKNGNTCVQVFEGEKTLGPLRNTTVEFPTNTGSIVVEFDIMAEDTLDFDFKFTNVADNLKTSKGADVTVTTRIVYFNDGKLRFGSEFSGEDDFSNYRKGIDTPIYATPGQWMHIACAIDVENNTQELYVNYVSLGTRPLRAINKDYGEDTCFFRTLKLNETAKTWKVCYDNLKIYQGSAYRIIDKYANSDADETFEQFVDYMCNETNSLKNRMYAYNEAQALLDSGKLSSRVSKAHVAAFEGFDYINELYVPSQDVYLSYIEGVIQSVKDKGINSANIAAQQTAIDALDEYIVQNTRYIDQTTERYINAMAEKSLLAAAAERINGLSNLIQALKLFDRAPTSMAMQKNYENAKSFYVACQFEIVENLVSAEADPSVIDFLANSKAPEEYRTIYKYYNEYIPKHISDTVKKENSQKIIDCVEIIKTVAAEQDRANNEAVKAAALLNQENIDFVNTYVLVIRGIVNADNYDPTFEGVGEALALYDLLNKPFYDLLMQAHYAVIKEQLDMYPLTEAYIGRAGICKYIENYIELNKVDMETEIGRQYLYLLGVYKAELDIYKDDFVAVLEANTKAFIGTVNKMTSYVTYKELKPLYDEAIEKYYYNMNVDAPETQAAIALFEEYEAKLEKIEEDSAMLIGYAKTLATASRKAQVYRALVNCGKCIDGADEGIEGVSAAISTYEKKLAEYNEEIAAVNGDVSNVIDIVCSVRSNSIAATVLAVVKKLFSK